MPPNHVRIAVRLYVKQLTVVHTGQPLSSEITCLGCRPCRAMGKATSGTAIFSELFMNLAESETLCMHENSMLEHREISKVSDWFCNKSERVGKTCDHTPSMYAFVNCKLVNVNGDALAFLLFKGDDIELKANSHC